MEAGRTHAAESLGQHEGSAEAVPEPDDLRDFFEHASSPFLLTDADGVVLHCNQAALDFVGYEQRALVGHSLPDLCLDAETASKIRDHLTEEPGHRHHARLRHAGGAARDAVLDCSALWRDGAFVHTRCVLSEVDTTDMSEASSHLRALVDSSDDAIISKGHLDGVVQTWNAAAERIFGYTADEMIGRSIRTIIPAEHQHEEDSVLARIRAGERVAHFETIRQRKDGQRVPVSLTVSPVRDARGTIIGASKVARDISERLRADEALRETSAAKDEFVSLVSHELRTPIATIVGNSQLLLRRGERLTEDARRQSLQDVVTESERLQRIVENLLVLSRLNADAALLLAPIDLAQLARETVASFERRMPLRNFALTAAVVPMVDGEMTLLTLVLQNLVGNAVKYSADDTTVEVLLTENLAGRVELHVLDRGIGISLRDISRIFTPFYRASAAVGRAPGMGLGLAVSRRAIEVQGGTLRVEVRAGGGSDFSFSLSPHIGL